MAREQRVDAVVELTDGEVAVVVARGGAERRRDRGGLLGHVDEHALRGETAHDGVDGDGRTRHRTTLGVDDTTANHDVLAEHDVAEVLRGLREDRDALQRDGREALADDLDAVAARRGDGVEHDDAAGVARKLGDFLAAAVEELHRLAGERRAGVDPRQPHADRTHVAFAVATGETDLRSGTVAFVRTVGVGRFGAEQVGAAIVRAVATASEETEAERVGDEQEREDREAGHAENERHGLAGLGAECRHGGLSRAVESQKCTRIDLDKEPAGSTRCAKPAHAALPTYVQIRPPAPWGFGPSSQPGAESARRGPAHRARPSRRPAAGPGAR